MIRKYDQEVCMRRSLNSDLLHLDSDFDIFLSPAYFGDFDCRPHPDHWPQPVHNPGVFGRIHPSVTWETCGPTR